jgi:hypothetical protein
MALGRRRAFVLYFFFWRDNNREPVGEFDLSAEECDRSTRQSANRHRDIETTVRGGRGLESE